MSCAFSEQRQRCKRDQPDIGWFSSFLAQPERIQQGRLLAGRQRLCQLHEWTQRLLKSGKRQINFSEHAGHAQYDDVPFTGPIFGLLEQR